MTGSSACGSGLKFFKQTQPNPRTAQRAGHYIMTNTGWRSEDLSKFRIAGYPLGIQDIASISEAAIMRQLSTNSPWDRGMNCLLA
jgi:hypothetical protein